ncbi:CHAT domain-containing protein [Algoriphagus sp.]|uniref:CHAT domain-containing protein n=1 Tax=Algoriphagus sp. TaxID=1872435 RepID=UPI0039191309
MPKLSWLFYLSLSVFLLFIQTDSNAPESKELPPSTFEWQLSVLEKQREELSPEMLLPEIEKLDLEIQLGVLKPNPEELIQFYVLFLEALGENDQAEKGLKLASEVAEKAELQAMAPEKWAGFYAAQGFLYDESGQTAKAVQAFEKAVALFEKQPESDKITLALTLNNLGYAYYNLGFQNKAILNYYKAFNIIKDYAISNFKNVTSMVRNIVYTECEYGNKQASADLVNFFDNYIQEAEKSDTLEADQIHLMKINQHLNKSQFFELVRDSENMEKLILEVEDFMQEMNPEFRTARHHYQLTIYESAGALFKVLEQYDKSKFYYQKMQDIPLSNFYQMKYAANLALVYYYDKAYSRSLEYAEESLRLLEEMGYRGSSTYTVMVLKAELLNNLGKGEEAKDLIVRIYSELLEKELSEGDLENLNYRDFNGMNTDRHITIIIRSGNIYRDFFRKTGHKSDFNRAYNFYQLAAEMFHEYYLKGSYNAWLETLNKEIKGGVLSLLAETSMVNQDSIISSLNLLEENASQELWKKFVSKNEETLGKTAQMISEFNLKQLELEGLSDSISSQSEKRELKLALEKIGRDIAEERTFDFFSGADFDMKVFQNLIPEDEQVLKFYVADKEVFGVLINSQEFVVRQLGEVKILEENVNHLRASILEIKPNYSKYSQALFHALLDPFSIENGKRLQIIPDDFLHLLPFEVLSEDGADFFIEKIPIAYQHSFKLLKYRNPVETSFNPDFLIGFAPSYEGTPFSDIKNNLEETKRIVSYHSGEAKVGKEASKRNFVASFANYRIHHLAMHTEQLEENFDQSALVFANAERLKLDELYQMNFPSEMVVLSACNTGVGQLQPGEGLASLSRALTFAGVKSSVYSLWEVPDKETSELMIFFYEEIKKGLPKDQALAESKRRFLKENPLKKHPIFWAGFVINGQLDPIQATVFPVWIGVLGVLIFAGLGLYFWREKARYY